MGDPIPGHEDVLREAFVRDPGAFMRALWRLREEER